MAALHVLLPWRDPRLCKLWNDWEDAKKSRIKQNKATAQLFPQSQVSQSSREGSTHLSCSPGWQHHPAGTGTRRTFPHLGTSHRWDFPLLPSSHSYPLLQLLGQGPSWCPPGWNQRHCLELLLRGIWGRCVLWIKMMLQAGVGKRTRNQGRWIQEMGISFSHSHFCFQEQAKYRRNEIGPRYEKWWTTRLRLQCEVVFKSLSRQQNTPQTPLQTAWKICYLVSSYMPGESKSWSDKWGSPSTTLGESG